MWTHPTPSINPGWISRLDSVTPTETTGSETMHYTTMYFQVLASYTSTCFRCREESIFPSTSGSSRSLIPVRNTLLLLPNLEGMQPSMESVTHRVFSPPTTKTMMVILWTTALPNMDAVVGLDVTRCLEGCIVERPCWTVMGITWCGGIRRRAWYYRGVKCGSFADIHFVSSFHNLTHNLFVILSEHCNR